MSEEKMTTQVIAKGAEVVYTITVTDLDNASIKAACDFMSNHGCPASLRRITPATKDTPGRIDIPRLFTYWRGTAEEHEWQHVLAKNLGKIEPPTDRVFITVASWVPAPGYPMGEWDQDAPISSDALPKR